MTNSFSPPLPKTSANWPRSFLHRSNHAKPDKKDACAPFETLLSAPATRCFSKKICYKVAGIVLIGQRHCERTTRLLRESGTPTVELLEIDGPPIDMAIGLSNFAAAHELTGHLFAMGRRKVGFLSGPAHGNDRVQRRMEGYKAAVLAAGHPVDASLIAGAEFNIENGARVFARMLEYHPDMDGVVSNDILGLGVQLHCKRIGLSVPERMAITGFDDLEVSSILEKKLTTVSISGETMGILAGKKILLSQSGEMISPKITNLGYKIIWRDTTP